MQKAGGAAGSARLRHREKVKAFAVQGAQGRAEGVSPDNKAQTNDGDCRGQEKCFTPSAKGNSRT